MVYEVVSENPNVKYFSDPEQESYQVRGRLFGHYQRPLGVMTMEIKGKVKKIYFLIHTGSPKTYVCKKALNSYGLNIDLDRPLTVRLNKRPITVKIPPDNTPISDINILGTDFLSTYKAQVIADFNEKYFNIQFNDTTTTTTTHTPTQIASNQVVPTQDCTEFSNSFL